MPTIIWLKDGMPVSKRVTVSNTDGMSQLLIPSAERSDSGIYTIIVKNIVGQETFSVEIRVTGERANHIRPEISFAYCDFALRMCLWINILVRPGTTSTNQILGLD